MAVGVFRRRRALQQIIKHRAAFVVGPTDDTFGMGTDQHRFSPGHRVCLNQRVTGRRIGVTDFLWKFKPYKATGINNVMFHNGVINF